MTGGELSEYIAVHPCADRLALVGTHGTTLEGTLSLR